jgi:hypothetical protein
MSILRWLEAGAIASYGTVTEPCARQQKFPQASVLVKNYFLGNTAVEAYLKSVQWPAQGVFVGDPLARPFGTNPRVFEHPEPIGDAWRQVCEWLACESAWSPQPTERHADLLGQFLGLPGVHGNLVPDAHLATLAMEHGLTLCSTDGDFARFRGLRWQNPLAQ